MPAPKLRVAATKRPTPAESSRPADAPLTTAQRIVLPEYENIALVLQGGGALGSYQAGVQRAQASAREAARVLADHHATDVLAAAA
ncbi:hypothetical protein DL771_011086 [Monosporascus sp. 5C6A]|nr:hypothetical protein DL771_011086 [Monosporascus sp. 5C6A]